MDLSGGVVSGNPIGVNVSASGFDVERLQAGVEYRDNDVNLDSSVLYVPAPLVALGDVP